MKKIFCIVLVLVMLIGTSIPSYATSKSESSTRASYYLSSYGINLALASNHRLAISVDVEGKHQMTSIGVFEIYIEEYNETLGDWDEYDVWYGSSNPSLYYAYNSWDYAETFYFTGTPGKDYRVTFTCFAMDSTGGDTGSVISVTRTCV